HMKAGGVVRGVEDDDFRVRPDETLQLPEVRGPAVFLPRLPRGDSAADAACHFEEGLAAGLLDDQVVALFQCRVHEEKDRLLGPCVHEDLLRADPVIEAAYFLPKRRAAAAFRVAEPMPEKPFTGAGLQ